MQSQGRSRGDGPEAAFDPENFFRDNVTEIAVGLGVAAVGAAGLKLVRFLGRKRLQATFDVADTFRNRRFRDITLQPGTELRRVFRQGVNRPRGTFTTRGRTADRLVSREVAVTELALGDTSGIVPDSIAVLRVNRPVKVKVGLIQDGGENAFQYVFERSVIDEVLDIVEILPLP